MNIDEARWLANGGSNDRVLREAQTDSDRALGIPGRLIEIQGTYDNLATRDIEGVDFGITWISPKFEVGTVTLKAEGTYVSKLNDIDRNGDVTNQIRQVGNPRVKSLLSGSWSRQNWSAYFSATYLSDYENSSTYDSPIGDPNAIPLLLEAQWIMNASVGYRFAKGGVLEGTSLRFGVNNLKDIEPPLYLSSWDGYDSSYYNPRGRQWFAQLTHKF